MKKIKDFLKMNQFSEGYTLIEVVLVMAFVSLSFMSLYGIFAKTIQGDTESRNEIIASNLAQECIERIRNCRDEKVLEDPAVWVVANLESDCDNISTLPPSLTLFTSGGKSFTTSADFNGVSGNVLVTCTTEWKSSLGNNLTREVKIESLLSDWQKQSP